MRPDAGRGGGRSRLAEDSRNGHRRQLDPRSKIPSSSIWNQLRPIRMLGKTDVETDTAQAAPDGATAALDPLTLVKLAEDPCWFSFRINYLANHFNVPCYGWVADEFGPSRPEFVVLYSLALRGGVAAKNIVQSSGFPKNTISRAVQRLLRLKLVAR